MPGGAVSFTTLAGTHDGGSYELIDLNAHLDKLVRGGNVLAVEAHQATANDDDLVWDAELTYAMPPALNPQPIQIIAAGMEAAGFLLEWTAVPGRQYRVQHSADLISWTDIAPLITATNSIAWHIDSSVPAAVCRPLACN
jgi:hypothetical protein